MVISVFNRTDGKISDEKAQQVIRAANRQINEDFAPHWRLNGLLRLERTVEGSDNNVRNPTTCGDAAIYLWSGSEYGEAVGHHLQSFQGVPFGCVFPQLSDELDEPWSVSLSHQAIELLGDPDANRMVMGPHPTEERAVFHCFELCDAVQAQSYTIDGVDLTNFLLPGYFAAMREPHGVRSDFLGVLNDQQQPLPSFRINSGGYIGFYDPVLQRHDIWSIMDDFPAQQRLAIESTMGLASRTFRYQSPDRRNATLRELTKRFPRHSLAIQRHHGKSSTVEYESLYGR